MKYRRRIQSDLSFDCIMAISSLVLVADVQSLIHAILPPLDPILLIVDPAAIWAVLKVEIFTQKKALIHTS